MLDELALPLAIAAGAGVLIVNKPWLHSFGGQITREDRKVARMFAAVTARILPLLPDVGYGPFQAFKPRPIWFLAILFSGVGFVIFFASRIAGDRAGLAITGLPGGLLSCKAETISFSCRWQDTAPPCLRLPGGHPRSRHCLPLVCQTLTGLVATNETAR